MSCPLSRSPIRSPRSDLTPTPWGLEIPDTPIDPPAPDPPGPDTPDPSPPEQPDVDPPVVPETDPKGPETASPVTGSGRQESESERLDRNLQELLGELRVALPGVQVLFAFLLVVPFNQRFADLTPGQERLYLFTLLSAGFASALLIAPTAQHRITFRMQEKDYIVSMGNRLALAGLAVLALSMTRAIGLVVDVVFSWETAVVCAAVIGLLFAALWYAMPIARVRRRNRG